MNIDSYDKFLNLNETHKCTISSVKDGKVYGLCEGRQLNGMPIDLFLERLEGVRFYITNPAMLKPFFESTVPSNNASNFEKLYAMLKVRGYTKQGKGEMGKYETTGDAGGDYWRRITVARVDENTCRVRITSGGTDSHTDRSYNNAPVEHIVTYQEALSKLAN